MVDVLVIGSGPAALAITAALGRCGVNVIALAPQPPETPWENTYGVWGEEVDSLGLSHLLAHRWSNTVSWFGPEPLSHERDYGLFDRHRLQQHWLEQGRATGVLWQCGQATRIEHGSHQSTVSLADGSQLRARLVVDASGHQPVFVRRPDRGPVAGQAAYGIVGRFSAPPVDPSQFVLMDFRADHLAPEERQQPPTFLYAMDLGDGVFFVEETSLALAPAVPFAVLKQRLQRRLSHRGVAVQEIHHEEFCLFPMNLPLPDLDQPVVGFGGAASMVHPASGYMVGALLRRAPVLAEAMAEALADAQCPTAELARRSWRALWPQELRRKHALYQFGLEKLMRFPEEQICHFFETFFHLPNRQWYGFLTNTLPLPELVGAMLKLYGSAPWDVRWGLMEPRGREADLLTRVLTL
ncbi:lycopene cyclase family protein [Synechococcus sp. CCY9201]|uniref:lycopene beta cyclase n=1 Tax=Synechococcus sp. CCY9201 TaxID=174697 RepID=UPI002B2170B5|nr:lycopene cyclase family protein [Synechococcus sp. CCY9201]MEA5475329.1 lycopene cyclase family protein [Synechococcus sp. CCY9201]